MKAILSVAPGGTETLVYGEAPSPAVKPGELLIAVKAVGINFPDVLIIQDKYQYKPERPFSPGGEAAGVVMAVGEGVTDFGVGDRVLSFCSWGGLAEQLATPAARCARIPDAMPFDEAAALIFTYGTSYYALKGRGQLKAGERLLVLGAAGGVGLAAVELGRALGAEVIAACSSQEKVDVCLLKGAQRGLVYSATQLDKGAQRDFSNQIKEVAAGGIDVVLDAVGGSYSEPALRTLNWEGRFLVLGFPAGVSSIPLNLPLLKSCDIRGVFWGAWTEQYPQEFRQSIDELFALYETGLVRPHISNRYPLARAGDAIAELQDRKAIGKIVVMVE